MRLLALLLAVPAGAEFHIGLYNLTIPDAAQEVRESGFTHVLSDDPAVAQAATGRGLKVVGIPRPAESPRASSAPPVAVWYISDEPEVNRQSPELIATMAARVRRWSPGIPLALVVGDARYASAYASSVDVMMVDWYPVPHLPLNGVGEQVARAVSAAGGKPVWAVLQAMDWKDYPQRNPDKPRIGRFPTRAEIRLMTFDAVARGASGVYYFEFQRRSVPAETLLDHPERWQALRDVVRELAALKPFLDASPGASLDVRGLRGRRWQRDGRSLTILVNAAPEAATLPEEYRAYGLALGPWEVAVLRER